MNPNPLVGTAGQEPDLLFLRSRPFVLPVEIGFATYKKHSPRHLPHTLSKPSTHPP